MDVDEQLRDMRRTADGIRNARERIAGLTGTGSAADGRVRVTWTAGTGLDQLYIDPRAMRMSSDDLAAAAKAAIVAAISDLRGQTAEVLQEETGVPPDGAVSRIADLRESFDREMNEIAARIDGARRQMERALTRLWCGDDAVMVWLWCGYGALTASGRNGIEPLLSVARFRRWGTVTATARRWTRW